MQDALFGDDALGERTWTVDDLSRSIGAVVEQGFPGEVWVRGEIRNLPPPGDGRRARPHLYFDLIEPPPPGQRPKAVLAVVLWSADRRRVNADLRRSGVRVSAMDNGVDVRIRGRVRWWAPGGRVQLQMTGIDPDYTLGRLAADREAVLAALDADGLLDRNRRLPLPLVPERIGVVTSMGSAAHADVRRVLEAAGLGPVVVEVDARTQGPAAADTIPAAMAAAVAAGAEVVLLVRGGGSRVELACFDHEPVARAVATCPVPVITGIGHEIDSSVTDAVAHTACATPTAAASLIATGFATARADLEATWAATIAAAGRRLDADDAALAGRARHIATEAGGALRAADTAHRAGAVRLGRATTVALGAADARLRRAATATGQAGRRGVQGAERELTRVVSRLGRASVPLDRAARDLDAISARVRAADPRRALDRGWSITHRADGSVLRSAADASPGETLTTTVADGTVRSTVDHGTVTDRPSSDDA